MTSVQAKTCVVGEFEIFVFSMNVMLDVGTLNANLVYGHSQ